MWRDKKFIFVSDIPVTMTEEEIRGLFEPHGEIKDIRLLRKKEEFKGMCVLDYNDEKNSCRFWPLRVWTGMPRNVPVKPVFSKKDSFLDHFG